MVLGLSYCLSIPVAFVNISFADVKDEVCLRYECHLLISLTNV